MNVNIRQDKLNSIMTKYLDSIIESAEVMELENSITIYLTDDDDELSTIIRYFRKNNELHIFNSFLFQFRNIFPIDRWDARDFIGEWFSNKFNTPVSDVF